MIKAVRGLCRSILNITFNTLFPLKCTSCSREGSFLCGSCETKLEYIHLIKDRPLDSKHLKRIISCFQYKEPISSLIILGKYSFMPEVFSHLAELSAQNLKQQGVELKDFTLCPIPLSKQRLRWRGFNQSQQLCQTLSNKLGLPQVAYLMRQRDTKTQKDLSGAERQRNVKNCFALDPVFAGTGPRRKILLVDDVATTGATLNAAAEVLVHAGAETIWAFTIARD